MGPSSSGSQSQTSSSKSSSTSITDFMNQLSNWFSNFQSGQSSSPWAATTVGLGEQFIQKGGALFDTLDKQLQEALKTGGVGAQVPFVQNAVGASTQASNAAMSNAKNALSTIGAGNDPLSQGVLAGINMQGQQTAANIGPQLTEQFISMAPGVASSTANMGFGGLETGAGLARNFSGQSGGTGGQTGSGTSSTLGTQNTFSQGTGNFQNNQSFDWGGLLNSLILGAGNSFQFQGNI